MSSKTETPTELADDALTEVAGGMENITKVAMGQLAGGIASGGGGGGGGGGFAAQASFQPLKTEPGEEMPSDMTQPILRK